MFLPRTFTLALCACRSMTHTEERIAELGITLPTVPSPLASYVPYVISGNMLYLSGHVPFKPDMKSLHVGKVGKEFTTEEAADIAKFIAYELVATMKTALGDLDRVIRVVKLVGFVNCVDDFTQQPEVINGCSNVMAEVFGKDRGSHARSAVGTNSLPRQVPVEIEATVEISPLQHAEA